MNVYLVKQALMKRLSEIEARLGPGQIGTNLKRLKEPQDSRAAETRVVTPQDPVK